MSMLTKIFGGLLLSSWSIAFSSDQSGSPVPIPLELQTRLESKVVLPNFGTIAYRGPRPESTGPIVVLYHGVYGGASHLSFRYLIDLLDKSGARVFAMDLPGTGQSEYYQYTNYKQGKIRTVYTSQFLENFVVEFNKYVVKEPSILVGQATISMPVLAASKQLGNLVKSVVLLSPTGVHVLASAPTIQQRLFGIYLRSFERKLNDFYLNNLLSDANIIASVSPGIYDKNFLDETFFTEFRLGRNYLNQKWISLSFVEGRLSYKFESASKGVLKPILMIFGKEDKGIPVSDGAGNINNVNPDREADFSAIRPEFHYVTLNEAAAIIWEEKAREVCDEILNFAQ